MASKLLSPESEQLTFICGLGWPEVSRYYLSHRRQGMWEFWEQPAGSRQAGMVFGWLADDKPREAEVAKRLMGDFLGTFKATNEPKGEIVQGLLSIKEIQRVLRKHTRRHESNLLKFPIRPTPTDTTVA